jgi:mono/diheme cytochrome c family protein
MRSSIIAIAAASVLLGQAPPAGDAKNGRKLFQTVGCYQCHGHEGQGGLGTGPRLGPKPIAFLALKLYTRHPTGQMPPYTEAVLPDKELADIYAFLQSLKPPPAVKDIPLLNQ